MYLRQNGGEVRRERRRHCSHARVDAIGSLTHARAKRIAPLLSKGTTTTTTITTAAAVVASLAGVCCCSEESGEGAVAEDGVCCIDDIDVRQHVCNGTVAAVTAGVITAGAPTIAVAVVCGGEVMRDGGHALLGCGQSYIVGCNAKQGRKEGRKEGRNKKRYFGLSSSCGCVSLALARL